jgi:hypothetical protein
MSDGKAGPDAEAWNKQARGVHLKVQDLHKRKERCIGELAELARMFTT